MLLNILVKLYEKGMRIEDLSKKTSMEVNFLEKCIIYGSEELDSSQMMSIYNVLKTDENVEFQNMFSKIKI